MGRLSHRKHRLPRPPSQRPERSGRPSQPPPAVQFASAILAEEADDLTRQDRPCFLCDRPTLGVANRGITALVRLINPDTGGGLRMLVGLCVACAAGPELEAQLDDALGQLLAGDGPRPDRGLPAPHQRRGPWQLRCAGEWSRVHQGQGEPGR